MGLLSDVREKMMRGARSFSEPFAARVFNEGLPELVSKIKNENTEENARQVRSKHSKHGTLIATAHHSPLTPTPPFDSTARSGGDRFRLNMCYYRRVGACHRPSADDERDHCCGAAL